MPRQANFGWAGPTHFDPWAAYVSKGEYDKDINLAPARMFLAWWACQPPVQNWDTAACCLLNLDSRGDKPNEAAAYDEAVAWLKAIDWTKKSEFGFGIDAEFFLEDIRRRYQT